MRDAIGVLIILALAGYAVIFSCRELVMARATGVFRRSFVNTYGPFSKEDEPWRFWFYFCLTAAVAVFLVIAFIGIIYVSVKVALQS